MVNMRKLAVAFVRALLIATAALVAATLASAQPPTFKLEVSAVGLVPGTSQFYRGTTQVTSSPAGIDCRSELLGAIGEAVGGN